MNFGRLLTPTPNFQTRILLFSGFFFREIKPKSIVNFGKTSSTLHIYSTGNHFSKNHYSLHRRPLAFFISENTAYLRRRITKIVAMELPSLRQGNSEHSGSESDMEKEASYEQIWDQSPTREIEEGDEIADGLVWALRPGVVVEQEADDFLNSIGEVLDEKNGIEQPEAAPQGDRIEVDQVQVERIQHQQAEYIATQQLQEAQQLQQAETERQQAQELQLAQEAYARYQAEQNFFYGQAQPLSSGKHKRPTKDTRPSRNFSMQRHRRRTKSCNKPKRPTSDTWPNKTISIHRHRCRLKGFNKPNWPRGLPPSNSSRTMSSNKPKRLGLPAKQLREAQELQLAKEAQEIAVRQLQAAREP